MFKSAFLSLSLSLSKMTSLMDKSDNNNRKKLMSSQTWHVNTFSIKGSRLIPSRIDDLIKALSNWIYLSLQTSFVHLVPYASFNNGNLIGCINWKSVLLIIHFVTWKFDIFSLNSCRNFSYLGYIKYHKHTVLLIL